MPIATIVVPAFNVAKTLRETLDALLAQTFEDFEIVIIDDGSSDTTYEIAKAFQADPRVRFIRQRNRGLAGARNSGIAQARGAFIGFCDADDLWEPGKLAAHVAHLQSDPAVGISYAGSSLINDDGDFLGQSQKPRLKNVDAVHIFKRNPIGNGSAPVIRRAVFDAIAFRPASETERDWYFDETFRQSEDIECWLRIALSTDWVFEGVSGLLTRYRISAGGLSAATERQHDAWEQMVSKLTPLAPDFFARHAPVARSYQLRYLARRAISDLDGTRARHLLREALKHSKRPLVEEPIKSLITILATLALALGARDVLQAMLSLRAART